MSNTPVPALKDLCPEAQLVIRRVLAEVQLKRMQMAASQKPTA